MGEAKRFLERAEEKKRIATNIAIHTKVLIECEVCNDITDPGGEKNAAYAYANALITKDAPSVRIFKGNRQELRDTITEIIEDCGAECYCQQKMRSES